MRLLTDLTPGQGRYDTHVDVNIVSLPTWMVNYLFKTLCAGMLALLAFLCRTKTNDRRDPRLLGEVALIVLTMLFLSERSWKHHYVTLLLPYSYLVYEFFSIASVNAARASWLVPGRYHVFADGIGLRRPPEPFWRRAGSRDRPGVRIIPLDWNCAFRHGCLRCGPKRSESGYPALPAGPGLSVPRSHLLSTAATRPIIASQSRKSSN